MRTNFGLVAVNFAHVGGGIKSTENFCWHGADNDKTWLTMKNLRKHVLSLRNHPFNLAHNLTTLA